MCACERAKVFSGVGGVDIAGWSNCASVRVSVSLSSAEGPTRCESRCVYGCGKVEGVYVWVYVGVCGLVCSSRCACM